jgi:nitric oxide reductase subunit B
MKRYWLAFILVIVVSFTVLIWIGTDIYQQAPPFPASVQTPDGNILMTAEDIKNGQNVWQAMGGMEVGTVWGHGSYVAPDWTADWLHRECVFILNYWSLKEYSVNYDKLQPDIQAMLRERLVTLMRTNTYDKNSGKMTIDPVRELAFNDNLKHYEGIFINGDKDYAIPPNAQPDKTKLRELACFFFWTSWAASTNRPGKDISYTSNWPHEELVNNTPSGDTIVWTGVSIIMLLTGIGAMSVYHVVSRKHKEDEIQSSPIDPLLGGTITPSQRAVIKYFFVVAGLFLLQILMGVITAHYGVEGNAFYGIPLAEILPYSVSRTWHIQLAILWIATAWLAAGMYVGPSVGGVEPKGQRLGVNILFAALILVVLGSMAGQWLSIENKLSGNLWFYFGHQGYEYLDLGRIWQIALLGGLFLWLFLVARTIVPVMKRADANRKPLIALFLISTISIVIFYIPGIVYGRQTNLSIVEYWRWWVVHLWVEGFFEVFATVVIAFLFANLRLIEPGSAARASLLSSTIFLSGGIIGTLHHLYFAGTPTVAIAFGSVFSALEVVPLVFVGYEAWGNYKMTKATVWMKKYKWPIYYFISVSFWNLVGAGLFGFMINPPIALYYMQGLNTTPVHGHAALFGVYGMLGIALMLFAFRSYKPEPMWKEKLLSFSFWAINIGLMGMIVLSLLPIGLLQTKASVEVGYWYARSPEFLKSGIMGTLHWMRMIGDTIFAVGAIALVIFVAGLITGRSYLKTEFSGQVK